MGPDRPLATAPSGSTVTAPAGVEPDYPLTRLTTICTGGRAEFFARAGDLERLVELLRWAAGGRTSRQEWSARARTSSWPMRACEDW